jgi:thioredoxin 1
MLFPKTIITTTVTKRIWHLSCHCLQVLLLIAMMQSPLRAWSFAVRSDASQKFMMGVLHRELLHDDHGHVLVGTYKFLTASNNIQRRINGSRTSAALQMVVTKSGGRAIQSQLQFDIEVLHQVESLRSVDSRDDEDLSKPLPAASVDKCNTNNRNDVQMFFKPSTTPTLVFFSAPWCGPCRLSNPVVKEIIKQFVPRIDVVEVCTDDLPEIAEEAGVTSIPTIQIYHEGKLLDTIVGCVAKNVLGNAVNKVLEDLGLDTTALGGNGDGLDNNDDDGVDSL